ncbi:MAG: hypothetical protein KZQ99_07660 [Candidatus Thiodiazotropha sp. (ex Dulcina madagascariensis)]|nr:hypothetical protein [Candidatus Thiodiazotropha sp. (ex Dulcina madagascariensis)]
MYVNIIAVFLYSPFCISDHVPFYITELPLTTISQMQQEIPGGEGFQMVMTMAYSPSDPKIIYMGSDTSQVWKSLDSGYSWFPINNGYAALGSRSLLVHPKNSNIIFSAGMLGKSIEQIRNHDHSQGIFRTIDGGKHWEMLKKLPFYKQESRGSLFAIDSRTLDDEKFTIYVGTHDGELLVSNNSGDTWKRTGFKSEPILEIVESPLTPGTLLIASKAGLYRYDSQKTVNIGKGLPTWPRSIAVSPDKPEVVYVALGGYGVYKSIDAGRSFTPSLRGVVFSSINDIEASFLDAGIVISTSTGRKCGPLYSHDGGDKWLRAESINAKSLTDGGGFYFSSPIAMHPENKRIALTSSNGRAKVLSTTDAGVNWSYSGSGYRGGRLGDVISLSQKSMIFVLTDHGAWRTDDRGRSFYPVEHPKKGGRSISSGAISGATLVFAVGSWKMKHLLVSRDMGISWEDTAVKGKLRNIRSHKGNSRVFYADDYFSHNAGSTWTKLSYPIMTIDPTDNDKVYTVVKLNKFQQLLVSKDRGRHWTRLGSELPATSVRWLEIDPFITSRFYAATGNGIWVFDGNKWSIRNKRHGLQPDHYGKQYYEVVMAHSKRRGLLIAGKRSPGLGVANGLFYSQDHGESWMPMPDKILSNTNIWSASENQYDGAVYVGTSHGVYRLDLVGDH